MESSEAIITPNRLALYPFLPQAVAYVESLEIDLKELSTSPVFDDIIPYSVKTIKDAIRGVLKREYVEDRTESDIRLLSYPVTRILLSCLNDQRLMHRYAVGESKAARENLRRESEPLLMLITESMKIHPKPERTGFTLHYTEYVKIAHRMKERRWKLTNRDLRRGYVSIERDELIRLLEERIRERVMENMPVSVSEEICRDLQPYIEEIREALSKEGRWGEDVEFGEISMECFPPCITHAIKSVQTGVNISHSTRFALTSFLLAIGMKTDTIIEIFGSSPDFDPEKTRYQIEHIRGSAGKRYTPPSCATMETFGNCMGKNRLCERISHPLNYYRRKMWLEKERKQSS